MSNNLPALFEIFKIAANNSWVQRCTEASSTLFFNSGEDIIDVFYTTGGVMTQIDHPKSGAQ